MIRVWIHKVLCCYINKKKNGPIRSLAGKFALFFFFSLIPLEFGKQGTALEKMRSAFVCNPIILWPELF